MPRTRKRKIEPAVMNLCFTALGQGALNASSTHYIDLSRAASVVNRRFYRQGLNWSVAGFTITTSGTTAPGTVTVCKAPTTWVTYNAWVKAKAMWDQMNDQVLDDEPSIEGRYHDFKVFLDSHMSTATLQTSLIPTDGQILQPVDCSYNFPYTDGGNAQQEWDYSTIQIPTAGGSAPTIENTLHIVGGSAGASAGIIHGYGKSRARPVNTGEPNVPEGSGWMIDMFNLADNLDEVRDDLIDDNDRPPYPVEGPGTGECYPGGAQYSSEVVGYAMIGGQSATGAITAQRFIKGGMFPCGLIQINSNLPGLSAGFYDIIVHLVPGHHRGYLAQSMEEV